MTNLENPSTGELFGDLWHRYDAELYEESIGLFEKRFKANGFDLNWFKEKKCLDAGCGGGRFTIAMARQGASEVVGLDISVTGLADATRRAKGIPQIRFVNGSTLELPFEGESFDFVCSNGVLHHTPDTKKGISEVARVLRPGGRAYFLLYGSGGLRWETLVAIRPLVHELGYAAVDAMFKNAGLAPNKQRTFLDDLFVPILTFFDWETVETMLTKAGFGEIQCWTKGRLDHEASATAQRADLEILLKPFSFHNETHGEFQETTRKIAELIQIALHTLDKAEQNFQLGHLSEKERDFRVIGWGHHRVLATKASATQTK